MAVGIQIEEGPLQALFDTLYRSINRSISADRLLFPIMRSQQLRTEAAFRAEVDPDGKFWEPLAASTLRRKAQKGYSGKQILEETGYLFNSLRVERSGTDSYDIVFGPEYGKFHNTGTARMPKRSFLGFNETDVAMIETQAVDILLREICGSIARFNNPSGGRI